MSSSARRLGGQDPGTAGEQIGARRLEAADRGAGERMAADEAEARGQRSRRCQRSSRLVLPTSVTSASSGARSRRAARGSGCSGEHGRREDDQIGVRHHRPRSSPPTSAACSRIAVSMTSLRSTAITRLPASAARRQRDRPADQPEADDGDPREEAAVVGGSAIGNAGVSSRRLAKAVSALRPPSRSVQLVHRHLRSRCRHATSRLATLPIRAAPPARGRCCGRSPAR